MLCMIYGKILLEESLGYLVVLVVVRLDGGSSYSALTCLTAVETVEDSATRGTRPLSPERRLVTSSSSSDWPPTLMDTNSRLTGSNSLGVYTCLGSG